MVQLIPPKRHSSHGSASHLMENLKVSPAASEGFEVSREPLLEQQHYPRGRVVIFIDSASLFYGAMQLEIEIDYTRLLRSLTEGGRLVHAFFYTGVDPTNDRQKGFLRWMQLNNYRVIAKELVQFPDGSRKANINVEMAIDMMKLAPHCDTMILLSGDGEMAYALNAVIYKGITTEVVCLRSMISESLINTADRYIDLTSIKHDIQKRFSTRRSND